jgi:guanylate kinase
LPLNRTRTTPKMIYKDDSPLNLPAKPLLIVLSGLSGAGKDAVLVKLRESKYPLEFIVTVTTRAKRTTETDGVHYRFVSRDEFQTLKDRHELLEYANVYGNWYGVPKEPVRQALARQKDVIVKVDVQGANTIKKLVPQAVFIFLATPMAEEVAPRLKERHTETPAEIELRLKTAKEELKKLPLFDYLVLNKHGELDSAVNDVKAIIAAEKCRVASRTIVL